ncbi:uncharacterized protein LOC108107692 [Drosophila eugracilis]|uniref:uncharacterized protein LOC108107692 n=1 Tax=Drosophila eugracilis TaxID=29029 RepID=UPI0007E5E690|nr:uncharacterized protein LOC108107692 [Drosophila eugracilis]
MDTLLQRISGFFGGPGLKTENVEYVEEAHKTSSNEAQETSSQETRKPKEYSQPDTTEPITSGDVPTPDLSLPKLREQTLPPINYEMEFVDFVDRNAPKGMSKKIMEMLPYLQVSFLSWPAFWFWRGYNWQYKRRTERIGFYIQRTYQQAKLMQLAIIAAGLLTVSMGRPAGIPIELQTVKNENPETDIVEDSS